MLNTISTEINEMKGAVEKQNKLFAKELKEVAADSAERDAQVSKFVELEVQKVIDTLNTKYDKLKYLLSRVLKQFKTHLARYEESAGDFRQNIDQNQNSLSELKMMMKKSDEKLEVDLGDEIKKVRAELEEEMLRANRAYDQLFQRLAIKENGDFEVLKGAIDQQSSVYNEKIDKLAELSEQYHQNNFKNLRMLVGEVDNIRKGLQVLDKELEQNWVEYNDKLQDQEAELLVVMNSEAVHRREADSRIEELVNEIQDVVKQALNEIGVQYNSTKKNMNDENEYIKAKIEELTNELSENKERALELGDNARVSFLA